MQVRKLDGFTLIELMIVVAIVGILAAIAIPAYKDFTVRARISEVLASMAACKTRLEEIYQASSNSWVNSAGVNVAALVPGVCDQNAAAANQTKFISSMTVAAGPTILATTTNNLGDPGANNRTIVMTPRAIGNTPLVPPANIASWLCDAPAGAGVESRFRPGSCQG